MKHIKSSVWAFVLLTLSMVLPSAAWADGEHQLTVKAKPTMAGTFNTSAATLAAGETIHLYAYANSSFTFVHWTDETGAVVSEHPDFTYTMPDRDVQLTAAYEYNPANPANPAHNYWNPSLGEVIVDDFATGQLQTAVRNVIDGSASSEVMMITVAGVINSNDFGIINTYSNCTLLDLSRVSGVTQVPSYAFDYTKLESVYLPASIESIGYRAFYQCQQLSSLIVYAMTPPTLGSNVFTGVPEGLVVYVPAAAIAQYQDADGWKNFTILPIQEDIRSISVSLPEGSAAADYAKMWLELTNTKSGQRMHYVMTDRTQYTFSNIIRNTTWNVTLRNERGDVFGKIDNVEVKDEDVSVVFSSLSKPQSVALSVLTPDGQDVTAQTQVTWTDAAGNYLAQGASLSGLPAGYQASYRITLPQELAMAYNTPQQADYVLTNDGNNITCQLTAIPQVQISGKVKDQATSLPLSGATVSVSQTFGGKYSKTLNTKTDGSGMFTIEVANVPTSVAFAATDYISQTLDYSNNEWNELNEFSVPDVKLKAITGATISIGFTYTSCSAVGEEAEMQNWYSDYNNVDFALYNETKQQAISQYNVQYPQIVLLEEVEDGDVLRLTATSRTNAFMPVTATATIAEQTASATFDIVELGKISSSFTTTGNTAVVGTLYDAAGKLMGTYNYLNASLTINDLADGNYTLVSMGSSRLFNTIYDLAKLPQTGLAEGTDYVKNTVNVQSGVVSQITIDEVPTLDESKLYYTGENTSFTVNKPSIVAGNYLTLTGLIDFKPAYATNVGNVQMIVDLPESCQFVENSVMVGNSTSSYTLNGSRITIPMARYTDRVRFCVIPTLGGEYAPSAFAQFDLSGETVTQPIGFANYSVENLSISVPSIVAKTTVPVSGTAIGTSSVEIYDNGVLIGQTTSLANGTWATTCELNEPYNLSRHQIYAKVTTKQGIVLQSESKEMTYDVNAIQIQKVTMFHYNPEMNKTFESVFDFQNPHTSPNKWTVYYPNKKFTYTIDFTNNSPEKVSNVVLYVHAADGRIVPLYPTYDEEKDTWVADIDMGNHSDSYYPVNVSLDYSINTDILLDADVFRNSYNCLNTSAEEISHSINELINLSAEVGDVMEDEVVDIDILAALLLQSRNAAGIFGNTTEEPDFSGMTEEEVAAYAETLLLSTEEITDENMASFVENYFSQSFEEALQSIDGITVLQNMATSEELQSEGYVEFKLTDSNSVFILATDTEYVIVDFVNNRKIIIDLLTIVPNQSRLGASRDFLDTMQSYLDSTKDYWDKLRDYFSRVAGLIEDVLDVLDKKNAQLAESVHQLDFTIEWIEQQPYKDKPYWKNLLKKYNKQRDKALKDAVSNNNITHWIEKNISPNGLRVGKIGGGIFTAVDAGLVIVSACDDIGRVMNLYRSIPNPCQDDQARADNLRNKIRNTGIAAGVYYTAQLASDIVQLISLCTSVPALIPSGGTSLTLVAASVGLAVANFVACYAYEKIFKSRMNDHYNEALSLKCLRNCGEDGMPPCPPPPPGGGGDGGSGGFGGSGGSGGSGGGGGTGSGSSPDDVQIDPSGFVFEGVATNRLQGVIATAYYKENVEDMYGDLHENIVKWNAEEYAQENPLFTDEYGMYRWDVPQGLWQVKYEKEGYETTYSEWLPVPPPQLDVNIAMKQNVQPMVKNARAYEDAVEVEFDKYMMPELLTAENIMVMQNGTAVEGAIELLNEEVSYEGETETFASKVRFNAAQPFTEQEITLLVNNRVKSYAGIRMQDNYEQAFTIEQEIKQIACEQETTIGYGNTETYVVSVLPASASAGKTLAVKTSSPMILSVENENIVIGSDGKAEITMTGELPGTAALTFSIEGADITSTMMVSVEQIKAAARPTSSVASGSMVQAGTAITLSCASEGATIYYTLDGSCPCDESAERLVYDGTPIVINKNTIIKAMATGKNWYDSEVATFIYIEKMGDVNCDGNVDTQDAIKVIQYYLNKHPKVFMVEASDVTNDKKTDTQDAIQIIRIYLNNKKKAIRK